MVGAYASELMVKRDEGKALLLKIAVKLVGKTSKNAVNPSLSTVFAGNKSAFGKIVFAYSTSLLPRTKSEFEAAQSVICERCSPEVKTMRSP